MRHLSRDLAKHCYKIKYEFKTSSINPVLFNPK